MSGPIKPRDLAELRFRDDVVGSVWYGTTGKDDCPQSEKDYYLRDSKNNKNWNPRILAGNWYNDHIQPKLDSLNELIDIQNKANDSINSLYLIAKADAENER